MNKKILIPAAVLIVLAVALGCWLYFYKYKIGAPIIPSGGTVENLINKIIPPNPAENLPDTNPINKANPFRNLKTNPF